MLQLKKILTLLAVFGLLTAAGHAQTLTIKLAGGLGYSTGGDLAAGIRGQSALLAQEFQATGAFLVPKTGLNLAGEIVFYPWAHFGIGIGEGYFQTVKQSSVSYSNGDLQVQETINPRIRTTPVMVTLNLHWDVPLTSWLHVDVSGGAGLYSATLNWDYKNSYTLADLSGSEHYTFRASKNAVGYQGGLGLEYLVSSRVAIVLDLVGRVASIGPFSKGVWTDQLSGSTAQPGTSGNDHTFWYYNWTSGSQTYAQIAFQANQPTGDPAITNVRTGKIDLNGFAAMIGIRIAIGR